MALIDLDIFITYAIYLLFAVFLAHIILEARGRKARKKRGCLEVYRDNMGVGFWVVGLLFNTILTVAYYMQFLFNDALFFAVSAFFLFLLMRAYYDARWKVVIDGEKIIKYGLLFKNLTYNISDITKIEYIEFSSKFYIGNKKIFTQNPHSHTGDLASILRYI